MVVKPVSGGINGFSYSYTVHAVKHGGIWATQFAAERLQNEETEWFDSTVAHTRKGIISHF